MLKINLRIIFFFIILIIIVLTSFILAKEPAYTLRCEEFLWCHGNAHCGGSGWQTAVCIIQCEGGGQIECPKNDIWF